jgi:Uncharacterized protein conserved in bacteria
MEIIFITPTKMEDCQKCVDHIKQDKIVHINLEDVEHSVARRIIHYVLGAVCIKDGRLVQPAGKVYCTIPKNLKHSLISNADEEPEIMPTY